MKGRWIAGGLLLGLGLLSACATSPQQRPGATPSPTSGVQAQQTPGPAPTFAGVATMTTSTSCKCSTLHLLSLTGGQLATVTLGADVSPSLEAGPQGLYYVLGTELMRLDVGGSVSQVGTVAAAPKAGASVIPGPQLGALAVAPSGTEWAYFQTVSQSNGQTEQVWLGEANVAPRLLISTPESAALATAEFPNGWSYQLLGWQGGYLVLAQVPQGSSSFASQDLEVSLVNPQTGAQTVVSNAQNCPVAAVSSSGGYVCFQEGAGDATEVVTGASGITTGSWPLSPSIGYGAASFAPTGDQVAFTNCPSCSSNPSGAYLNSQMDVLDTASGAIHPLGANGLVSDGWASGSQLIATQYSQLYYARSGSTPLSQVVVVDVVTGQVSSITTDTTSQFLGIATS